MPYVLDDNLKEDEQQNSNNPTQIQISGASPTTDSEGNMTSTSPGSSNTSDTQKELVTGSGYQNLDKYLQTNQPKAFGSDFYGKVQGDVDSAKKSQDTAASQFGNVVQGSSQTPTSDQVNSAIANPTQADPKQFQQWESQTYKGPNSLAESPDLYNQYWSGTQKANTNTQLAGSEPGRFTLLDSYFGRPKYSFGEKSLDNLLVQQSGLGQTQKDLQNQAANLTAAGNAQAKQLQGAASEAAGKVEQSRTGVQNAIGVDGSGQVVTDPNATGYGAIGKQYTGVNQATTDANKARADEISQVQKDLASGTITADEAAALGLTDGQQLFNVNPLDSTKNYFSAGQNLTNDQTMTADQRSYIKALSQLAGITDTFAAGTPGSASPAYSYNSAQLANDAKAAGAEYQRALQETPVITHSANGTPFTYTMSELRRQIQATKDDISGNNPGNHVNDTKVGRLFLTQAEPALAKAEADLAAKYQVGRTLKVTPGAVAKKAAPSVGVR